eukprot:4053406-Pleurochrysis_carterae.AAC.1
MHAHRHARAHNAFSIACWPFLLVLHRRPAGGARRDLSRGRDAGHNRRRIRVLGRRRGGASRRRALRRLHARQRHDPLRCTAGRHFGRPAQPMDQQVLSAAASAAAGDAPTTVA